MPNANLGMTCRSAVLCLQGKDPPTEAKYSHDMHKHKIFILSKDDMKASCTVTEQAFVYAEGCYFLFSW